MASGSGRSARNVLSPTHRADFFRLRHLPSCSPRVKPDRLLGDALTDNAYDDDGYRFHDVLHLANMAVLGWSPVMRRLLKRKRKSLSKVDEVEDGARALIVEEMIVAFIYCNAKERSYYKNIKHLDSEMLATIKRIVGHLEVRQRRTKDWEQAIQQGYAAFRHLLEKREAVLKLDLKKTPTQHREMKTEPLAIKASGIVDAWRSATEHIIEDGERFDLSVHVTSPGDLNEVDVARYCHRRVAPSIRQSVYDVANTIFPKDSPLHQADPQAFFARYRPLYERGQRRHPTAWGTYFLRLVSFGSGGKNQLLKVVEAMKNWNAKPRAAFVVHLSSAELDNPRLRGGPCWQYGQFIRSGDDEMSLVAVYRSHDYFQKALGNFVGLNRLLKFVCHHSGMRPGTLTCLSTFAHLQNERTKNRQLLSLP